MARQEVVDMTVVVSFDTMYDLKTEVISNATIKNRGDFMEFIGNGKKLTVRRSQILHILEIEEDD